MVLVKCQLTQNFLPCQSLFCNINNFVKTLDTHDLSMIVAGVAGVACYYLMLVSIKHLTCISKLCYCALLVK